MRGYISRFVRERLDRALARSPVVALLGPRQCGKSTLAKHVLGPDAVYLDLQDRSDANKLREPELFFAAHRQQLVCLDEIQLLPDFFTYLRSEVDRDRRPGRFLLLGSASRDLIRQSSETLAGRIAFVELTPFVSTEVAAQVTVTQHWSRGGFPDSLLAFDDEASFEWRQDFIRTFLERDIPALGLTVPIPVMERLWRLLAHYHGQLIHYAKVAAAADLTVPTLKKYLGILEQTYMLRLLRPAEANLKKRLVKSPKVYLRDSGLVHALLDIENYDQLLAHPIAGETWEGWVIEQLLTQLPRWRGSFIRSGHGAEIDLIVERGSERIAIECKLSKAPRPSRGLYELQQDLGQIPAIIVAPVDDSYALRDNVRVMPLAALLAELR